ncbi:hypothetical protein [Oceanobacillus sojae]|uniref:hypothetical protein n=1 Tax=Oceanobacillus sojae TaxID=582851 RepID=UPI0021A432FA|nr:hypothetical protein [Oceanobacillus sojae]MCT1904128.1 hypothetical protein [Oceanobacillus sojae]
MDNFKLPNPSNDFLTSVRSFSSKNDITKITDNMQRAKEEEYRKDQQYKDNVLNTLYSIEKNTADIKNLVGLLHYNQKEQTEILEVISEMFKIATSKNAEEAESMYKKTMKKITNTVQDAESITKLVNAARVLYETTIPLF